eukprot:3372379-Rhodomonas_salina.1
MVYAGTAISLRTSYAMSGTDMVYAGTAISYVMSGGRGSDAPNHPGTRQRQTETETETETERQRDKD